LSGAWTLKVDRRRPPLGAVAAALGLAVVACSTPTASRLPPAAPASGPPLVYVAVGASETAGFGSDQPLRDGWPRVLFRTALPASSVFVNMGIPGATVAQALRDEVPQTVTVKPTLVTVWLNVNDILAGVSPSEFERDLGSLVHSLRRDGLTRVLVANVPPLDHLPAYLACRPGAPASGPRCRFDGEVPGPEVLDRAVDAYDAATARVAAREGALLVDLNAAGMAARDAGSEPALVSGDGFHPSSAGHQAVASAFAEVLRRSGPLTPAG
jgi:lysophospholipase L1-like esterase